MRLCCVYLSYLLSGIGVATDSFVDRVQVVVYNDLHGALTSLAEREGAIAMSVRMDEVGEEVGADDQIVLSVGDTIGAESRLESAMNDDVPTLEIAKAWRTEATAVGDMDITGRFDLESFVSQNEDKLGVVLGANVFNKSTNERALSGYVIIESEPIGGHRYKIGVIGATLESLFFFTSEQPQGDTPAAAEGATAAAGAAAEGQLEVRPAAESVNELVEVVIGEEKADVVIVLIHQGAEEATSSGEEYFAKYPKSEFARFLTSLDSRVDVVASGHSHQEYLWWSGSTVVTQAGSHGRGLAVATIEFDSTTHNKRSMDVRIAKSAEAKLSWDSVEGKWVGGGGGRGVSDRTECVKDIVMSALRNVERKKKDRFGLIDTVWEKPSVNGESPLGALVADSMVWGAKAVDREVQFGLIDGDSLEAGWDSNAVISRQNVWDTLPHSHSLISMTLTGSELIKILENMFEASSSVLQVSGFTFTFTDRAAGDGVVDRDSLYEEVSGDQIELNKRYRIVTTNLLASGGHGFHTFLNGEDRRDLRIFDNVNLENYLSHLTGRYPSGRHVAASGSDVSEEDEEGWSVESSVVQRRYARAHNTIYDKRNSLSFNFTTDSSHSVAAGQPVRVSVELQVPSDVELRGPFTIELRAYKHSLPQQRWLRNVDQLPSGTTTTFDFDEVSDYGADQFEAVLKSKVYYENPLGYNLGLIAVPREGTTTTSTTTTTEATTMIIVCRGARCDGTVPRTTTPEGTTTTSEPTTTRTETTTREGTTTPEWTTTTTSEPTTTTRIECTNCDGTVPRTTTPEWTTTTTSEPTTTTRIECTNCDGTVPWTTTTSNPSCTTYTDETDFEDSSALTTVSRVSSTSPSTTHRAEGALAKIGFGTTAALAIALTGIIA